MTPVAPLLTAQQQKTRSLVRRADFSTLCLMSAEYRRKRRKNIVEILSRGNFVAPDQRSPNGDARPPAADETDGLGTCSAKTSKTVFEDSPPRHAAKTRGQDKTLSWPRVLALPRGRIGAPEWSRLSRRRWRRAHLDEVAGELCAKQTAIVILRSTALR